MCELFGITSKKSVDAAPLLKEFFSHSVEHKNGWGAAVFSGNTVSVKREPIRACDSTYLKEKLNSEVNVEEMVAHIRRATVGLAEYDNTHPFIGCDSEGRTWTLIHNGHIFDAPALHKYMDVQKGSTDSERILLYIIDRINELYQAADEDEQDRFRTIEDVITELSPGNKLIFILYDGEFMYVHNNEEGSLHVKDVDGGKVFSTKALDGGSWSEVMLNRLLVYRQGEAVYEGAEHHNTFVWDPEQENEVYLGFSQL